VLTEDRAALAPYEPRFFTLRSPSPSSPRNAWAKATACSLSPTQTLRTSTLLPPICCPDTKNVPNGLGAFPPRALDPHARDQQERRQPSLRRKDRRSADDVASHSS
jgi:hypothetical protein